MTVRRVALTGGIATGKSYVLGRFRERSLPTVDTDQLSREVVRAGEPASEEIRRRFGADVFQPDGQLDRARIAQRVFSDASERAALEAIVHPHVRAALDRWFADLEEGGQAAVGIAAIPLLYETGRDADFDTVVVTSCEAASQLQRLMTRDRLSEPDARKRVDAQSATGDKVARADFVIRTDGSFESTDQQVDAVCERLLNPPH